MSKPGKFLNRMIFFVVLVIAITLFLKDILMVAFMANPMLNGLIILALIAGLYMAFTRVTGLTSELDWIANFKKGKSNTGAKPRLLAAAATMLTDHQESNRFRLSAVSTRSILDSIGARLEESREMSRYMTSLLVFLGLLGTFWGLLGTIGAIGQTINGLSVDGSDLTLMFDDLKAGLEAPLSGMGVAFSSSLFGLAGSLVLGFMDLQASQAQTRFYNDLEDWLSSLTRLSQGDETTAGTTTSPSAYMTALMEQTADGIDRLERTLSKAGEDRDLNQKTMTAISEALATLGDRMASQNQTLSALQKTLDSGAGTSGMDEETKTHLRNVDLGIKRLIEEQTKSAEQLSEDLRGELKLLSRTIGSGLNDLNNKSSKDD